MHSTVTDLTPDLQYRLRVAGMDPGTAQAIAGLLPPAGQHELIAELRDNPNALQELGHTYPGTLAERFRTGFVEADEVRAQLLAVAR